MQPPPCGGAGFSASMVLPLLPAAVLAAACLPTAALAAPRTHEAPKPHILMFLADDFGHYDISYNNPDAPTPTLQQLASEGVVLDRHYVYQYCSPTRSSFMSGRLPIHVNTANHPTTVLGGVDLRMQTIAEALKSAGYACHTAGKWHAGAHLWSQLPTQRGFDSQLGYLNGMEDHYTQVFNQLKGVDLWLNDAPALGMNGTYGAFMYSKHLVDALSAHDYSAPVFVYAAWQNTHSPLEVPEVYLNKSMDLEPKGAATRQTYFGMTACMDECVANVTLAHKAAGGQQAWANTLVVFSADNGGETAGGGNNWPWRGGKYTDFEGGCRVAALVSGGLIPAQIRGTRTNTTVHICDWFQTFSNLAGATLPDPHPGVPPMDSLDVWAAITSTNGIASPRVEVPLSATALIVGDHKLLLKAPTGGKDNWQNPMYPEGSTTPGDGCDPEVPCLFDLGADPFEHTNLANDTAHASVLAHLTSRIAQIAGGVFQTGQDGYTGGYNNCTTLDDFKASHGGFVGPLCTLGGPPPSPAPAPGPPPAQGVAISWRAGQCLVPASNAKAAPVGLGACSSLEAHRWAVPSGGGAVTFGQWRLRVHDPPRVPASCVNGTTVIIGKCPDGVGISLVGDTLISTACQKESLCVLAPPTGSTVPTMGPCGSELAKGWGVSKAD